MSEVMRRPFYTEYAWAFDLLIDRPVRKECATIAAWLVDRGVQPGAREPLFRKRVSTERGELTFTSVTTLDVANRQLISEQHELAGRGIPTVSDYHFVMRCWERAELDVMLAHHGFGKVSYFGAYDPGVAVGATDRLVAVAQRVGAAA